MRKLLIAVMFSFLCLAALPAGASEIESLISEMISTYSAGNGVADPSFIAKVNEVDEHLRVSVERDHDIASFRELIKTARKFHSRKSARKMFEVVLEKAFKRLQFTKVQQDFEISAETREEIDKMILTIEKYLDPNIPDLDTVDRQVLENKRESITSRIKKDFGKMLETEPEKRVVVEVVDSQGNPAKLSASRESNLLEKLKTIVPDAAKIKINIKLTENKLFDMEIKVNSFIAPNGFSVIEGELGFGDVALEALDNSNATEVDAVFGDAYFKRYRIVQSEEQLNIMPKVGEAAYEMGSFAPGQTWKMPLKKAGGISGIIKELEGNTEIAVVNDKTAKADHFIEFKNTGSRNMIFLQGTDVTGLVSVKAVGFLVPKKGQVTFKEALLIVDDEMASDITSYIGGQGINWFLKRASDNLRKGLPFTPILENLNMDRDESGKMVYIFSGRGPVAR
ncbi:MAG: hypothetical protein ACOYXC_16095 [Candidatus Rifleibacteriota bacterium]